MTNLKIIRDTDPLDPRKEFDHFGTIATWHRRYKLGDEQPDISPDEWKAQLPEGSVVLPVYMLDHSGITISIFPFNDRWDSGQLGFIAATPDEIKKMFLVKRLTTEVISKATAALTAEIEEYNHYLTGEVWGYMLDEGENGEDSCWGFYGSSLEYTGIAGHLSHLPKELVEKAWEARE